MGVVTISREMGSRGFEIASTLAEELGYRLVWREFINQAAIRAGTPEVALAMIDELNLLDIYPSSQKCQSFIKAVRIVLNELAQQGDVVILGRGGQVVLRDHPGAVHVRIITNLDIRVNRVATARGVSFEAALAQIKASDRSRRLYIQKFYQSQWDDPRLYDLIINTTRIEPMAAVNMIRQLISVQGSTKPQQISLEGIND